MFNSDNFSISSYKLEMRKQMKIKSLKKQKHWYLIYTWADKAFKDTVVNWALPSLHGGSLTVPLN